MQKFQLGINPVYTSEYEGYPEFKNQKYLQVIEKLLDSDPIIFEAGGHEREDTVVFAANWPDAQIISFEPNSRTLQVLRERTQNLLQ